MVDEIKDQEEFGDESEEKEESSNQQSASGQATSPTGVVERVKLPREGQVLGVLEQRLGASRLLVKCFDGKSRTCRVPGRMKRRLWLREGDVVLVEPWEHQGDEKGDVVFKYTPTAAQWLKKKGYIKIEAEF